MLIPGKLCSFKQHHSKAFASEGGSSIAATGPAADDENLGVLRDMRLLSRLPEEERDAYGRQIRRRHGRCRRAGGEDGKGADGLVVRPEKVYWQHDRGRTKTRGSPN